MFGDVIREALDANGLDEKWLAKEICMTEKEVNKWLDGRMTEREFYLTHTLLYYHEKFERMEKRYDSLLYDGKVIK